MESKARKRKLDAAGPEPSARGMLLMGLQLGHSVRASCGLARVSESSYYRQRASDTAFALDCDRAKNEALCRAESKLLEAVQEGDLTAVIFYLKTRGDRKSVV